MQLAPLAHRLSLPAEGPRRTAVWSLLMVVASVGAMIAAGVIGTFLQLVVLGLGDQDPLTDAGAAGYIVAVFLIVLMALPGVVGVALGIRARRLGERRLGAAGIVANVLVATYVVVTGVVGVVLG